MAVRKHVTARQARLGRELRKLREAAGLTLRAASRQTGIDEGRLSNTESGRVGVSADRVRYLAEQYACRDGALVDALAAMVMGQPRGWWDEYRGKLPQGFLDLAELEEAATGLCTFESVHVPGLLQTEEHVRAMYAHPASLSQEQVRLRTSFRLKRQWLLNQGTSLPYDAVIHEAALRVRVGDRKVARNQLLHILEVSEWSCASIRVIPFDVDGFTRMGNPVLYVRGAVPQLDTVLLDSARGGAFVDDERELRRYGALFESAKEISLDEVGSRELIQRLLREL
ncbi:helix-turn-helix domain-containing protein [Streptomyces boncukensis]|uniref:Helix-turn-helix domain-containing protein n=1 Tax=Streptomyces boncukensis TaxID=2711219 RepID=A0A6G4XA78_9ACTN|nr:helix-turn-helix transcriptional regulator [Streptomyces boncukensis]NGO73654.1 helix-turn-helix domain-containing protein [Streptomyces boncukensis]